jgi:hypothetical protein
MARGVGWDPTTCVMRDSITRTSDMVRGTASRFALLSVRACMQHTLGMLVK